MQGKFLTISDISIIGVFSALAVSVGYLLAPVPNVELFTATIFLSGLLFGKKHGCLVGIFAGWIFGIYNPWGPAPWPLLFVQVFVRALVGYTGGMFRSIGWQRKPFWLRGLAFGATGFFLTSIYNIFAALSFVLPAGFTFERLTAELVTGLFLITLATLSNVVVFALAVPVAADTLGKAPLFRNRN